MQKSAYLMISLGIKGGLFGNSSSEIPANDLKQLETFFYKLSFFLHILDYSVTIATLTDLRFLWFREFYLESSRVIQVAIILGGRNYFCGDTWKVTISMMATMMNSILLRSTLGKLGVEARLQSSCCMPEVSEPYNKQRSIRHLEKGIVVMVVKLELVKTESESLSSQKVHLLPGNLQLCCID
ncbi:unnamed protein product [Lactuca virosa]|uniref:Uncharacterized protein n=1 Tax=Lactuca virosa TaxID=75947 RepID=A0AAU9PUX2_9ASTR|nr:unnamed protein product [Lactuca virosa]